MSNRGDRTREMIKRQSRRLFAAKGFSGVTMQDICEACEISRGGLYRHYVSTGEIFCAILADDEKDAFDSLYRAMDEGISASVMFRTFLKSRIRTVTDPEISIENAVSEFYAQESKGHYILCRRGETSIQILTQMLRQGVADGDIKCEDPEAVAKHVLWVIEGMAKHSLLMPLTEKDIEDQIALIESLISK